MPSFRARLTNLLLRATSKRLWRPGLDIGHLRRHAAKVDARMGRRTFSVPIEESKFDAVPALWIGESELATRNGTLLYLHGGAWCLHLPNVYRKFAATLSLATGMRVLLVDYRLAPEHGYPAAADDCYAVYRSLLEQCDLARPLAVAGDSAGGNLTLVTLMRARDAGLPLPCCAVTLSPATDITLSGPSVRYNADADPMFALGAGDLLPDLYCPGQSRAHPFISPLFGDWRGLPPLHFIAGSTEMLLDDSVRAQDRAVHAGVAASIDVWPDMPHVFALFDWLPETRTAIADIAAFIKKHALEGNLPGRGAAGVATPADLQPASRDSPA
jgi:epsilon-lactone hydrolase